ncbi:lysine N(6)-hydroxylase/L-ornithine N(5)-oxygenase family protein [Candidatus Gracilibacteria bacterium]|nr:lysine N(6)-hydroxylase/L-ornithine N(5)-oxygenase family protein [Candidatus Gracilibacteria bacterium]
MKEISLPPYIDIAIVGAGPQALTLATHLLQKRAKLRHRFLVFDPSGTWLSQWRHQFSAQEIPHLRSPAVHHPDPNPFALRAFAENRPDELFPPYDLPGTKLFEDFCAEVIRRWNLQDCVCQAKIDRILPIHHNLRPRYQLMLADGRSIVARRVVLATGSGVLQFPEWVNKIRDLYPPERLCHSQKVDLRTLHIAGETILIIGGGLTSGHLAIGAINRGAKVILMSRRELQEKLFDADPGWLGPKYLKGFAEETDWEARSQLIQQARNGGSMTPAMMLQLRRASRNGKVTLNERCEVIEATWQENSWQVRCVNSEILQCDRIWLATGTRFDATQHPLLIDILDTHPTQIVKKLPVLNEHLRFPGSEFYVLGGLAALQIGPVARNLSGGRIGCDRIVRALTKA